VKRLLAPAVLLLALAGCGRAGNNVSVNETNTAAEEAGDLNLAIGGDELSPIPEAEDDMIANDTGGANLAGNAAQPAPQPAPAPPAR
jgi:hypothetical protein